jgi:hypothetical protein
MVAASREVAEAVLAAQNIGVPVLVEPVAGAIGGEPSWADKDYMEPA